MKKNKLYNYLSFSNHKGKKPLINYDKDVKKSARYNKNYIGNSILSSVLSDTNEGNDSQNTTRVKSLDKIKSNSSLMERTTAYKTNNSFNVGQKKLYQECVRETDRLQAQMGIYL